MIEISLKEEACRGCQLCVEVCPVKVFAPGEQGKPKVANPEDCFGCLSCSYLCPSGALKHRGLHTVKNFYRDLDFSSRAGRFL